MKKNVSERKRKEKREGEISEVTPFEVNKEIIFAHQEATKMVNEKPEEVRKELYQNQSFCPTPIPSCNSFNNAPPIDLIYQNQVTPIPDQQAALPHYSTSRYHPYFSREFDLNRNQYSKTPVPQAQQQYNTQHPAYNPTFSQNLPLKGDFAQNGDFRTDTGCQQYTLPPMLTPPPMLAQQHSFQKSNLYPTPPPQIEINTLPQYQFQPTPAPVQQNAYSDEQAFHPYYETEASLKTRKVTTSTLLDEYGNENVSPDYHITPMQKSWSGNNLADNLFSQVSDEHSEGEVQQGNSWTGWNHKDLYPNGRPNSMEVHTNGEDGCYSPLSFDYLKYKTLYAELFLNEGENDEPVSRTLNDEIEESRQKKFVKKEESCASEWNCFNGGGNSLEKVFSCQIDPIFTYDGCSNE